MAVAEGEQQGEAAVERVRTLDFSQPTKFTTELRRRIGRALDPFCDTLGAWLAGELRSDVELSLTDIGQHTWAAAKARLPADAIAVDVQAKSIERHMLLSVELAFVLQALECLLGGDAPQAPPSRHLTEIDWVLTRGLLDAIVNELSGAWAEIDGPQLTRACSRRWANRPCRLPSAARSMACRRPCRC
jgi:flagellar motor switch protein FliM